MDDPHDVPPPPKNRGGRPRVVDRGVTIATWLPTTQADKIIQLAHKHDITISALLREWLTRNLT